MNRATESGQDGLHAVIEAAEAIAHEAREQLAELAAEREALTRAASEMMAALLALSDPDAPRERVRSG